MDKKAKTYEAYRVRKLIENAVCGGMVFGVVLGVIFTLALLVFLNWYG